MEDGPAQSENGRVQNAGETEFGVAILPFATASSLVSDFIARPPPWPRASPPRRAIPIFIIHLTLTPSFGRRQTGTT